MLCLTLLAPTCVYVHLLASTCTYLHLLAPTCLYVEVKASDGSPRYIRHFRNHFVDCSALQVRIRHRLGSAHQCTTLPPLLARTYLHATCTYLPLFSPTCMALAFDLSCLYVQSRPRHTSRRTISKNPAMTRTLFCYKYPYPDNLSHFRCTLLLSPTREYN